MKDSKGNDISIGDRVKVLWGFDNKIYTGRITRIKESVVTIATPQSNISTNNHSKITKIPKSPKISKFKWIDNSHNIYILSNL